VVPRCERRPEPERARSRSRSRGNDRLRFSGIRRAVPCCAVAVGGRAAWRGRERTRTLRPRPTSARSVSKQRRELRNRHRINGSRNHFAVLPLPSPINSDVVYTFVIHIYAFYSLHPFTLSNIVAYQASIYLNLSSRLLRNRNQICSFKFCVFSRRQRAERDHHYQGACRLFFLLHFVEKRKIRCSQRSWNYFILVVYQMLNKD